MDISRLAAALVGVAAILYGQGTPNTPFQIRAQIGSLTTSVENGGTVNVSGRGPGQATTVSLAFTYVGASSVTLAERPRISGSGDFTITAQGDYPATLQPSQTSTVTVQYTPGAGVRSTAQLTLPYTVPSTGASGVLTVVLTGAAAEPVFAWIPQPDGNVTAIASGGTIQFPQTLPGSASTVGLIVTNRGSAVLSVDSVVSAGEGFVVTGLPLLPAVVEPGRELRFNVRFVPSASGTAQGELRINAGGQPAVFRLSAAAIAPRFTYELIGTESNTQAAPAQPIAFPDTPVGSTSRLRLRLTNRGTAEGRLNAINVNGSAFEVLEVPVLPLIVAPGRSAEVLLVFSPAQPGRVTGRVRLGDDSFDLLGLALGPQFAYQAQSGGTSSNATSGSSLIFPATDVGRSVTTRFIVRNTGTSTGVISSIGLGSASPVYSVPDVPPLPLSIEAGGEASFNVVFAPNNLGSATSVLRVGADSFTLSGISNGSVALPGYRLNADEAAQPLLQPAVTLTLAQPYPLPLSGTLAITGEDGAPPADPAVQFASGGRTVSFRIPANGTQALFTGSSPQIRFQTGTVAENLRVTASFATEAGLAIAATDAPGLRVDIAEAAPRLLSVQATLRDNSVSITVAGFATSRSIRQIEFQFTVAGGIAADTTRFPINVENAFNMWYQSAQSRQFGSQFSATVPFTLQRSGPAGAPGSQAIQSVSVRLTNDRGSSETLTVPVVTQ